MSDLEKIICGCTGTTRATIIAAVKAGNSSVEDVGNDTRAGTVCGSCKIKIQEIIDEIII